MAPAATPRFDRLRERGIGLLRDDFSEDGRAILVAAAEDASPELVNEVISLSHGLIFVALPPERVAKFRLERMSKPTSLADKSDETSGLTLCLSVEAREGVTTGISAFDRAATITILGEHEPNYRKLVQPGHIFPVEVRRGGVLVKIALPEGALDVVKFAGASDAAVFLDLLDDGGDYLRGVAQDELARAHSLPIFCLSEITRYALEHQKLVSRVAEARLPTRIAGEVTSYIYKSALHSGEHIALVKGTIDPTKPVLTRVQSEVTCADVFGGSSPPARARLQGALHAIGEEEAGVLLYLRSPRRGRLKTQVERVGQQSKPRPAALMREYGIGAQILRDLGVQKIELLSESNRHIEGLETFGIEIVSQRPIPSCET